MMEAIIAAIIGGIIGQIPWLVDKFNLLYFSQKTKFNFSGKWVGLSEFIDVGSEKDLNEEHFFKLEAMIEQRGIRFSIKEKITGIFNKSGESVPLTSAREFEGNGEITNNVNLLFNLNETTGLTCGIGYLVSDTWGKSLAGFFTVRNVNGNPVIVKIELVKEGGQFPEMRKVLTKSEDQKLIDTKS